MLVGLTEHRHAFELAALLVPQAVWVAADGDIGQCEDGDVAMEDKATGATLVLHTNGTAMFGVSAVIVKAVPLF